jgi:hypothetical protein
MLNKVFRYKTKLQRGLAGNVFRHVSEIYDCWPYFTTERYYLNITPDLCVLAVPRHR